jgi:hypothetical protein
MKASESRLSSGSASEALAAEPQAALEIAHRYGEADVATHKVFWEVNMNHFVTALFAGLIAMVLISATAFVPSPAEAATDGSALKAATVACKTEAKDQKSSWLARRKYVRDCVARTVKLTPTEIAKIAVKEAAVGCRAEAKGKKIGWLKRRRFVNSCVTTALEDYSLNIEEVRKTLNTRDLRVYTLEEEGCTENIFC